MNLRRATRKSASCNWLGTASSLALVASFAPTAIAWAQSPPQTAAEEPATVGEVIVTASRRAETVSKLPFNVTALGGQQLERANISDVAALTRQVPNFAIQDNGPRTAASAIPIIRGLNASQPTVAAARYFQSPVGFYQGNTPITGFFPLYDLQRVEVLRGPQGTLYGAGSLSGAVRFVPRDPTLGAFSGEVTGSAGLVAHSNDQSYSATGTVNIPLGETLALRVNGRYQRDAGFIDAHDVLKRENDDYLGGRPVLANPSDVATSPGVYFNKKDYNFARTSNARGALLWKPTDAFSLTVAYNYAYMKGDGGNIDGAGYAGGPSPLDPRRTLEATGEYERSVPTLEPWNRRSWLGSVDASYDLGFATLSTTLAYGKTKGRNVNDSTIGLLGVPYGFYYTGSPANPRTVIPVGNTDEDRSYTEEIRLVSNSGGRFDYVIGAFAQQQRRHIGLYVYSPGGDVQSAAANGGSTLPIAAGGTYILLYPNNSSYNQDTFQEFRDYSVYGDLTWHVTDNWQVTAGGRYFHQTFNQHLLAASSFFFYDFDVNSRDKRNDQIFKLNTSYQLDARSQVYATWSQGFRRGGANAFTLTGPLLEPRELLTYRPDKTSNFEAGAKGTIGGIYYSADIFYVQWKDPQIDLNTPILLTPVVVNGDRATSKGFELEASGPIGDTGLSFTAGVAYAKARLSRDFNLPAGSGAGSVIPGAIHGSKGDRLPGAPDWSGAFSLSYRQDAGDIGRLTYTLGMDFRSSTVNQLSSLSANVPTRKAPGYALFNGSVVLEHGDWQGELYGANLADKRAVYSKNARSLVSYSSLGEWGNAFVVSRPREVGVRLTRRW